ncbi:MAG: hypothetical protein BJ554DRAFT_1360, partial [Olpidium bornovanus]
RPSFLRTSAAKFARFSPGGTVAFGGRENTEPTEFKAAPETSLPEAEPQKETALWERCPLMTPTTHRCVPFFDEPVQDERHHPVSVACLGHRCPLGRLPTTSPISPEQAPSGVPYTIALKSVARHQLASAVTCRTDP